MITHCNYLPCNARHGSFLDIPAQTSCPATMIADIFLAEVGGRALHEPEEAHLQEPRTGEAQGGQPLPR